MFAGDGREEGSGVVAEGEVRCRAAVVGGRAEVFADQAGED